MSRRWFWPLIAFGTALELFGGASLGASVEAWASRENGEASPGWTNYVPLAESDSTDPLPWLVAGIILVVVGVVPYLVAARQR